MFFLELNFILTWLFINLELSQAIDYVVDLVRFQNNLNAISSSNSTLLDCKWKTIYNDKSCPDPDINFYLYSSENSKPKVQINTLEKNFLRETLWDPHKLNIIYIHGYGGGDDVFPTTIIRDAYLNNSSYNVFIVDWSSLAKMPCYLSSVYNLNKVSKCTAQLYQNIRSQGVPSSKIICVGHSLGAHACGLISKYLNFRMHRIIGLDPAGPMIPNVTRLKATMANNVQVLYTNAGKYGDSFSNGKANFCINGGKTQPKCKNSDIGSDLCSHITSVCYLAESVDGSLTRMALPCARQCPFGPRKSQGPVQPAVIGQHTPDGVSGSYCLHANDPPYCPKSGNPKGHPWCCLGKA